jgi:hypothetical protein
LNLVRSATAMGASMHAPDSHRRLLSGSFIVRRQPNGTHRNVPGVHMTTIQTISTDSVVTPEPSVLAALQRAVAELARQFSTDTPEPREHYLSQAADHEDMEIRMRAWDAHEARQRALPQVL